MSIYDRARDALKQATPGPWEASKVARPENDWGDSAWRFEVICFYVSDGESPSAELVIEDADAALIVAAPELAAEVVRLHDEFAYLADDLDYEASDLRRNAPGVAEGIADLKSITATRIRAALEGVEE